MKEIYLGAVQLAEQLHRQFLDVIKRELDRLGVQDINTVQSFVLFNIGPNQLSVGELMSHGHYLGSNVSYNVKRLVESGYLLQERSPHDRRSVKVKLSPKGLALYQQIDRLFDRQVDALRATDTARDLPAARAAYQTLERFWAAVMSDRGVPL